MMLAQHGLSPCSPMLKWESGIGRRLTPATIIFITLAAIRLNGVLQVVEKKYCDYSGELMVINLTELDKIP